MSKQKIHLEYELRSNSVNIIWPLISTHGGLQQWIADNVEEEGDIFIFTWGDAAGARESRRARVTDTVRLESIRFHWEDESDEDAYWEIKITKNDLTNDYILEVTDYADEDETDYMRNIWYQNFEELHRNTGL